MKILHFLAQEAEAPRAAIFTMAAVSGAANTLLLALVNSAAEQIVIGDLGLQLLLMYLIAFAIYVQAQHYALTRSVAAVESALQQLKLRVADKVRRSDLRFIEVNGGIGGYAPLSQDAGIVSQGVVILVLVAQSLLLLVVASIYLWFLSPQSLVTMLLIYAILVPMYFTSLNRTRGELLAADRKEAALFDRFTGMLAGFKELKLNRRESDDLFADIGATADQVYRLKVSCNVYQVKGMVLRRMVTGLMLFSVVFIVPSLVPEDTDTILKVTTTVLFILAPLLILIDMLPILSQVDAAVTSLYAMEARLDRAAADADGPIPPETVDGFERIDLKALSFHYDDRHGQRLFEVGPFDLTLQRGERLFIVGGNGSGKSTLLKLLTGLYRPEQGRILLDGRAIMAEDRPGYRSLFTSVFTDFHLFDRLYGIPDLDPTAVNAKLTDLELGHKTRYTDQGFSNLDLSTGQKKRLAFLASVLKERPICVFDELAADQDPRFRRRFYEQILPDLSALGRTLVVVSHDDRYFHTADRVLRVRDGQVSEIDRAAANGHLEP